MPKQYPQAILAEVQVVPRTSKYKRIDHPACLCANSTPYELHTPPLLSLLSLHMEYRHMSGCLMWIAADILLNGETVLSFEQWNQCCCTFFIIDDDVHRIPWWTCCLHSTIIHFCLPSFLASMHRSHMLETIHVSSISALIEPSLGSQTSVACPDAQHKCQVQCNLGGLVDGLLFGLAHFLINNDSDWNSILTIFILIFFLSLPPDLSPRVSMRCIHLYVQCHHQTHASCRGTGCMCIKAQPDRQRGQYVPIPHPYESSTCPPLHCLLCLHLELRHMLYVWMLSVNATYRHI